MLHRSYFKIQWDLNRATMVYLSLVVEFDYNARLVTLSPDKANTPFKLQLTVLFCIQVFYEKFASWSFKLESTWAKADAVSDIAYSFLY